MSIAKLNLANANTMRQNMLKDMCAQKQVIKIPFAGVNYSNWCYTLKQGKQT